MAGVDARGIVVGSAVPSLVRWGVSADADLVYRSLSTFGPQHARTMAADLGFGSRRLRPALEELQDAGLIQTSRRRSSTSDGGGVRGWRAVPADVAVATLRKRALRPADPRGAGTGAVAEVRTGAGRSVPGRRLPDREATRRRLAELVAVERAEHLTMNPERAFSGESLAIAAPLDAALLGRRLRVRTLGVPPADGDRSAHRAAEFARLGGEYREAPELRHKLMIFDRRVALLAVDPLDLDRGAWEIVDPGAVESFIAMFIRQWSSATDPCRNGVPAIVLTQRERALVGLLAEGHTDASAAERLGLSTRSVTYTLRALMDRLGVDNRFQLGLALGALHAATPTTKPTDTRDEEGQA